MEKIENVKQSPEVFFSMLQNYLEAQLFFIALELDIFSNTDKYVSGEDLAKKKKFNERNTKLLLDALTSIELLEKKGSDYKNKINTNLYLNTKSEKNLRDYFLFWRKTKDFSSIREDIKNMDMNSTSSETGKNSYDFEKMAKSGINEMYCGRVQALIKTLEDNIDVDKKIKILDLGAGSGILGLECCKKFKNSEVIIYDQENVISISKDLIKKWNLSERAKSVSGNFITDDIGFDYDIIIASGIFDFVGDLNNMCIKIKKALKKGGYLYVNTHKFNDDFTKPRTCVLGWLNGRVKGLEIIKSDKEIFSLLEKAGFSRVTLTERDNWGILLKLN